MIRRAGDRTNVATVRRQRAVVGVLGAFVIFIVGLASLLYTEIGEPGSGIAFVVLLGAIAAASVRPICGLYAIVFFGLVGDAETSTWFPFVKNLSSRESLLFLSDKLPLSPLEILVTMTVVFWLIEHFNTPGHKMVRGPLFAALAAFTGFVVFGFIVGVAGGGDLRIALFEGRAMFIVLPVYALIVNLCDRRSLRLLTWTAVAAIFVNALLALSFLSSRSTVELETAQALGEHSAATQWNVIILLTVLLLLYSAGTRAGRMVLLVMCIPTVMVYLASQRRSAVAGLVIAFGFVALSLWWRNRARFLAVVPMVSLMTLGYTLALWNNTSAAGFPAQAIKSIVAADQSTEADRSSDAYRAIENFDINFTIQQSPFTGLGFGQRFYRPYPLPDISFFEFYEYIPHNSFMWIWIKMGFGGFLSMLAMFAFAIRAGTRSMVKSRDSTDVVLALLGISMVVMFIVFAFVDIAWTPQNMVFLALGFGLCSQAPRPEPEADTDASVQESQPARLRG